LIDEIGKGGGEQFYVGVLAKPKVKATRAMNERVMISRVKSE